jgi:hypothetical protein
MSGTASRVQRVNHPTGMPDALAPQSSFGGGPAFYMLLGALVVSTLMVPRACRRLLQHWGDHSPHPNLYKYRKVHPGSKLGRARHERSTGNSYLYDSSSDSDLEEDDSQDSDLDCDSNPPVQQPPRHLYDTGFGGSPTADEVRDTEAFSADVVAAAMSFGSGSGTRPVRGRMNNVKATSS